MGYFGPGYSTERAATSDFLEAIPPQYGYSVFAHKLRLIWLLDLVELIVPLPIRRLRINAAMTSRPTTLNCRHR